MPAPERRAGRLANGVCYNRYGRGRPPLVVLQGLAYVHAPLHGIASLVQRISFGYLLSDYTVWLLGPRSGLPEGYSLGDMARDYADAIGEITEGPVDVMGVSTGGSVAQHLAADHPERVRRFVLLGAAHSLSPRGESAQRRTADMAAQGRWREASDALLEPMSGDSLPSRIARWFMARGMALSAPDDPGDLIVTVYAEDAHAFRDRLGEITAPSLVINGEDDGFYTPALLRETAEGIPNATLVLYPGRNHGAPGRQLQRDVLAFLRSKA